MQFKLKHVNTLNWRINHIKNN